MVRLNSGNRFLKAQDVSDGDIITFLDEGITIESKFKFPDFTMGGTPHPKAGENKPQFNITVSYKGEDKTISLSLTNQRRLAEKWGWETSEWVNRQAIIEKAKTPQLKDMIVLTPKED